MAAIKVFRNYDHSQIKERTSIDSNSMVFTQLLRDFMNVETIKKISQLSLLAFFTLILASLLANTNTALTTRNEQFSTMFSSSSSDSTLNCTQGFIPSPPARELINSSMTPLNSSSDWKQGAIDTFFPNLDVSQVSFTMTVPSFLPSLNDNYFVLLSIYDDASSYDQIGIVDPGSSTNPPTNAQWDFCTSWTSGGLSGLLANSQTYHPEGADPRDLQPLICGVTYTFSITAKGNGNIGFSCYQGSKVIYSYFRDTGANNLVRGYTYYGYVDYTLYEEINEMYPVGSAPGFNFYSNVNSPGVIWEVYHTGFPFDFGDSPPSGVSTQISGHNIGIINIPAYISHGGKPYFHGGGIGISGGLQSAENNEYDINMVPATYVNNYQVKVNLDATFPYASCEANGGDIRFSMTNGTTIPYWIESWNDANHASIIWVKVPTAGTSEITMKFGDLSLMPQSNGSAVFDFFDDFTGTSIDTTKWNATQQDFSTIRVSNGIAHLETNILDVFTGQNMNCLMRTFQGFSDYYNIGGMIYGTHIPNGLVADDYSVNSSATTLVGGSPQRMDQSHLLAGFIKE